MTSPTVERFTARESVRRYHGWGVHDRTDDVFVWAQAEAPRWTAEHLAAFLNDTVPSDMHAWAVRRMLRPVSEIPLTADGLVRDDHRVRRQPDGSAPTEQVPEDGAPDEQVLDNLRQPGAFGHPVG
jgi:hypothetical protein